MILWIYTLSNDHNLCTMYHGTKNCATKVKYVLGYLKDEIILNKYLVIFGYIFNEKSLVFDVSNEQNLL